MKQVWILIVDDDVEDQQIMQEAFETLLLQESSIRFAETGEAALDCLCRYTDPDDLPRLIVLDLNMPKFSGIETLRMIKKNDFIKHVPVVIFSSSSNPTDMLETQKEGAADYISKPSTFAQYRDIAQRFASYCEV